ncbi:MAG TPA: MFS transporter [Candidatus Dormibacteraeota bacterium]|jgi:EmrB/QacA subfamily drug resistance transporter|nr:MFS transporter [Candidatus Dormibacteraeota bacterium]
MAQVQRPPCDEAAIAAGRSDRDCEPNLAPWVLATAIIASAMAFIDGTVVNVALPAIQRDLGASAADAEWIVEAYTLLLASLLLVGGALGDRYGRRRVVTAGVVLFAVTSAACGLAPSPGVLIGARALQGAAAALLTPGSLALISAAYPEERRGRAIGTWSGASAITTAIGPVLGGFLVGHFSWRWAFFVNLPLALAVLVLLRTRVPESRDPGAHGRLDWPGAALVSLGLGGVVMSVIRVQAASFDAVAVLSAVAGAVLLAAFLAWEVRLGRDPAQSRSPMLPLSLFRSRAFSATNVLTLLLYAALGGALFFVPFNLIEVHGYSPAAAGASLLPFVIIMALLSRWSGGLVTRFGARLPLTVGPLIAAVGFGLFAVPDTDGSYWTTFFPASVVLGLGMAITVAPLTTTVMGSVPTDHAGAASGVNNAVSRVASLLAIAVFGIVLVRSFDSGLEQRLAGAHLPAGVAQSVIAQESSLALAAAPPNADPATRAAVRQAVADAFVAAFRLTALMGAGLALASSLVGAVGVPGRGHEKGLPAGGRRAAPAAV